jgi:hypothetical protein
VIVALHETPITSMPCIETMTKPSLVLLTANISYSIGFAEDS